MIIRNLIFCWLNNNFCHSHKKRFFMCMMTMLLQNNVNPIMSHDWCIRLTTNDKFFLSLNILVYFLSKNCNSSLKKAIPFSPSNPPSKNWVLSRLPPFENLVGGSALLPAERGRGQCRLCLLWRVCSGDFYILLSLLKRVSEYFLPVDPNYCNQWS